MTYQLYDLTLGSDLAVLGSDLAVLGSDLAVLGRDTGILGYRDTGYGKSCSL